MRRSLVFTITIFFAFCLSASLHAQQDRIDPLAGGAAVTGTITKTSPTEIEIDARGNVKRFAVNEIKSVAFSEDAPDLKTARARTTAGQFEDALGLLSRVPPETLTRDLVKEDLEFYRALCMAKIALSGGGDKSAAAKALLDFVNAHAQSFHYFEACELVGDMAYAMGRYDSASEYYGKLATAPWPEYKMRAQVLDARALVSQGKFEDALKRYQEVVQSPIDSASANSQKLMAQVGQAACLAETGKPEEGQKMLEAIIRDNDSQDGVLFARAYNALGLCHLRAKRPKDALLAFLHVDLLFFKEPDAHAEALYYLGQLWTEVGKSDRAVAARSLLKQRYAGTPWASK